MQLIVSLRTREHQPAPQRGDLPAFSWLSKLVAKPVG
jgi:hypothetical protein